MSNVHTLGPADAPRQILGRDPAAILAAVQIALALLLSFGVLDIIGLRGQDDLAVVVTVLGALVALYLAWGTTETALAALVELVKAAVALGAIYGLQITTEQTGLLIAAITAITTAWLRTQTSPLARGSFTTIQPDDVATPKAA
jgi:hypothetical protein